MTTEEWINHCETRAAEAARLAIEGGLDKKAIEAVTKSVYFDSLPACAGSTIKHFIGCIAHGALVRLVDAAEARSMLYAAQVALQAKNSEKRGDRNGKRK